MSKSIVSCIPHADNKDKDQRLVVMCCAFHSPFHFQTWFVQVNFIHFQTWFVQVNFIHHSSSWQKQRLKTCLPIFHPSLHLKTYQGGVVMCCPFHSPFHFQTWFVQVNFIHHSSSWQNQRSKTCLPTCLPSLHLKTKCSSQFHPPFFILTKRKIKALKDCIQVNIVT